MYSSVYFFVLYVDLKFKSAKRLDVTVPQEFKSSEFIAAEIIRMFPNLEHLNLQTIPVDGIGTSFLREMVRLTTKYDGFQNIRSVSGFHCVNPVVRPRFI
jgi:hypothetical protein